MSATWQLGQAVPVVSASAQALVGFVCVSFVEAWLLLCVLRLETFWLAREPLFRATFWCATLVWHLCGNSSFVFIWLLEFYEGRTMWTYCFWKPHSCDDRHAHIELNILMCTLGRGVEPHFLLTTLLTYQYSSSSCVTTKANQGFFRWVLFSLIWTSILGTQKQSCRN